MLKTFSKIQETYEGFETEYMRILTYDLEEGFKGSYRSYDYHRMCTILNGEKQVIVDRKDKFIYDRNKFVVLPPNSSVDMEIMSHTRAIVYDISDHLIDIVKNRVEPLDHKHEGLDALSAQSYDRAIQNVVGSIKNVLDTGKEDKHFLLDVYAQELVYWMVRENRFPVKGGVGDFNDPLVRAVAIMQNEGNEAMTIDEISALLHMSASNLAYLFRKHYGMSPKEYQNILRMKKAVALLEQGRSVTETALDVGFNNISYFIRLFKERYGVTPKQHMLGRRL